MKIKLFRAFLILAVMLAVVDGLMPVHARADARNAAAKPSPSLSDFVVSVKNGETNVVRGVYAKGLFAYPVIQQPADNGGYVSRDATVVTQFRLAAKYGTIGLLAHNYLAGEYFTALAEGQRVLVVYGDGRTVEYEVTEIYRYQALQPNSGTTPLLNLEDGKTYTAWDVFQSVYAGGDHIAFQTCIESNGLSTWGRLFVIALPVLDGGLPNSR